jgi:hypothetical protein
MQKISTGRGDGEADGSRGDILATEGGGEWTLEGGWNTKFFHLVANGRRRKNLILSLEHEGVNVTEPEQIQKIIYDYYKSLFGRHPGRGVRIGGMLGQTIGGCRQRTTTGWRDLSQKKR